MSDEMPDPMEALAARIQKVAHAEAITARAEECRWCGGSGKRKIFCEDDQCQNPAHEYRVDCRHPATSTEVGSRVARAVLADLASTGNLLANPDDLRGSVGVVLGQLRAARTETERLVAENRALVRDAGNGLASLRRADGIERRQLEAERDRLSSALVKALEHLTTYAPGAAELIRKSAGLT